MEHTRKSEKSELQLQSVWISDETLFCVFFDKQLLKALIILSEIQHKSSQHL